MTDDIFLSLMNNAMVTVLILSAPALLVAILIGLGVGLLQALTQIQDQTLPQSFKLVAVTLTVVIAGPLLSVQLIRITEQILDNFVVWTR